MYASTFRLRVAGLGSAVSPHAAALPIASAAGSPRKRLRLSPACARASQRSPVHADGADQPPLSDGTARTGGKAAGAKAPRRGGKKSSSSTQPAGAEAPVIADGTWRIFGVNVAAASDPGKDDYSVHDFLVRAVEKKLGCRKPGRLPAGSLRLVRKSFDARKRRDKFFVYVVDVDAEVLAAVGIRVAEQQGQVELLPAGDAIPLAPAVPPQQAPSVGASTDPVVVVGSGPAGLFAALAVAEAGLPCVLLERGQPVEARGRDIGALFVRGQGNPESNLCYGEGGAGTWSDGKLTTRIGRNSEPVRHVLETLCKLGAPEHILVSGKPHLGTDRLVRILRAFRANLAALGVDIRFSARVEGLRTRGGRVVGVDLPGGEELKASNVVLAVGHTARDMYTHLAALDVALTPKPFAMGFRIEHPQSLIDAIQYGAEDAETQVLRGNGAFPVADYRLAADIPSSRLPREGWAAANSWYTALHAEAVAAGEPVDAGEARPSRGLFSFCQCPGGQIVPTATAPDELCINGMSFSRRNSPWANSAVVCTVGAEDWAHHLPRHGALAGVALQQDIEREAARRGGGNFVAPVQRAMDFLTDTVSSGPLPSSSYRLGVRSAALHDLYPPHITAAFKEALARFERHMPGFCGEEALLHAAETRTSAPVRVERDASLQSPSLRGLYPCGEGAGYAGGIMSAAVDGWRVGRAVAAEMTGRSDLADEVASYSSAGRSLQTESY